MKIGDGSGCAHETMEKSFIVPSSMECAKCGKPELHILRHNIGALQQDKLEIIQLTHGLQDAIATQQARIALLKAVAETAATYIKHDSLRPSVAHKNAVSALRAAGYLKEDKPHE